MFKTKNQPRKDTEGQRQKVGFLDLGFWFNGDGGLSYCKPEIGVWELGMGTQVLGTLQSPEMLLSSGGKNL